MNKIGSREDVMSGIAKKTSGGLTKQKLKYNKQQKIVSRKVSNIAKKNNRLGKARYITKNRYDGGQVGGVVKQTITFNYVYVNTSEIDKVTFINSVNESVSLLFFANINDGTPVAYLMYNDDLYPITMCTLFRYDEMPGNNFKTRRKQKWQEHEYLVINATNLPQFIINRSFIYPLTAMYIYYLLKEPSIERVGFDDLMLEWNRMEQKDHNKYEQYEQYEKESANFNLEKLKSKDWENTLHVDVNSHFYFTKKAIPLLKKSKNGSIINISSTAGILGFPLRSPYAASKWAIIGVTKTLAMELGKFNIRVNAVCPGTIKGDRMKRVIKDKAKFTKVSTKVIEKDFVSMSSMKQWILEEDIGKMCSFLISDDSSKVSGQVISVDGHTERND